MTSPAVMTTNSARPRKAITMQESELTSATASDDDVAVVEEDLVEDVSIDGMCGVY